MKIYSMTATFGKLANETLTLQPGLNVIHAPNEWGKSTWSAFIVCMLYGIDTKERKSTNYLPDKERYAPWSGAPMSGRMDICWDGRDITLERSSTAKVPLGEFRAYETHSGLPVAELTASNCGQMLLGVEKSVFQRAGFVRLTDMPLTQDEALRRRLNALVTTGDESGTADDLYEKLHNLRNKCKHNKTGLLPQAEAQRDDLQEKLDRLEALQQLAVGIEAQQGETAREIEALKVHQKTLAYEASLKDVQKVKAAEEACLQAKEELDAMEVYCQSITSREDAEGGILYLEQLRMDMDVLQEETLPPVPELPEVPVCFTGMTPQQALTQAQADESAYQSLRSSRSPLLLILGIVMLLATVPVAFFSKSVSLVFLVLGAFLAAISIRRSDLRKKEAQQIASRYGQLSPEQWVSTAQNYHDAMVQYTAQEAAYRSAAQSLRSRKEQLQDVIEDATEGSSINQCITALQTIIAEHNKLHRASKKWKQAEAHAKALADMAKVQSAPDFDDPLTYTAAETNQLLSAAEVKARQLNLQLGQCKGQIEALGQASALQSQLVCVQTRIAKLQETYDALTVAMETLTVASTELQRKFAPRLAKRAQTLFARMTGGRYNRLQLTRELGVEAAAENETVPQEARRRSDGTVDQLYLALRLAVAEELTPEAPLVLDDALVRFDDTRLAAAMDILRETAGTRQVILFSCQGREKA